MKYQIRRNCCNIFTIKRLGEDSRHVTWAEALKHCGILSKLIYMCNGAEDNDVYETNSIHEAQLVVKGINCLV